jgi:hypothetical protein
MTRYQLGETVVLRGRHARVVWVRENPSEIEAMDEYILEFEDKRREFIVSAELISKEPQAMHDRYSDRGNCQPQAK